MTTVSVLQGTQHGDIAIDSTTDAAWRDDVPSLASALRALLADARTRRVSATVPGDRWLALRVEEALRGFDDIQLMAIGHEPAPPMRAGSTAGTVSILAPQVRAAQA